MERLTPDTSDDIAAIIKEHVYEARSLAIEGSGSKAAIGDPMSPASILSMDRLTGIEFYEPEELVMRVRPGTRMTEVNSALDEAGQMFAFEPGYLGTSSGTIGGLIAANCHGARRIAGGAIRDSMMGLEIVTGRGEVIRSGGRVMKNVTGFDLVKLAPGSHGTLGCMTSVTLQTTPKPEAVRTLALHVQDPIEAVATMRRLRRCEPQPTALAWLPADIASHLGAGEDACILARVEGFRTSVDAKTTRLAAAAGLGSDQDVLNGFADIWQLLSNACPVANSPVVLCASVPPSLGARAIALMGNGPRWMDWGGGRIWAGAGDISEADMRTKRAGIAALGGSLRLLRAPEPWRGRIPALHPQPTALASLQARVREAFDPAGILQPGGMKLTDEDVD